MKQQKFKILQWGKERSIIQEVTSEDFKIILVDNQYLVNLDEMGVII